MVYYGETQCQAFYKSGKKKDQQCSNNAYYIDQNKNLCGVHSNKDTRKSLPKNPNIKFIESQILKQKEQLVENLAKITKDKGEKGQVIVTKMSMMKKPEQHDGYLKVFPNYLHSNRKDGLGCSSLSPKSMGSIPHGMPDLPKAKNLENYHQFAKVFPWELDSQGAITKESIEYRIKAYDDPKPYRHKFSPKEIKEKSNNSNINVNIPKFSVYYTQNGNERRYSYIECRYFYCYWFERIAKQLPEFKKLQQMIENGYHLQIVGYDGYPVIKSLYEHYIDPSRPFGHELVLYSLLVVEKPADYPWNIFYQKHSDLYKDVIDNDG